MLSAIPVGVVTAQSYAHAGPVWWDAGADNVLSWDEDYEDPSGQTGIRNSLGPVRTADHAFFQPLGSNGRACITCHQPSNAMGLAAATVRERWEKTDGKDPLFAAIDGSNCPNLPQAAKESHSLLLDRGLIRIALPWPPKQEPDFKLEVVRDPTGCNTDKTYGIEGAQHSVSVYRRPRITANFNFVVKYAKAFTLMTDGREATLRTQAITAALTHEQAVAEPNEQQLRQIIDFESQIYTAQTSDVRGGLLYDPKGPLALGAENMVQERGGLFDTDGPLSAVIWASFNSWQPKPGEDLSNAQHAYRASVARGSTLFASRSFHMSDGSAATCATCHSSKTVRWTNIKHDEVADLPVFRVTCKADGRVITTQDPGRGLITGRCADAGAVTMQQFHGFAARAPYFANGSAKTLRDVVESYDNRFHIGLTESAKTDLSNFLSAL